VSVDEATLPWKEFLPRRTAKIDVPWTDIPVTLRDALRPNVEALRKPRDGLYPTDAVTGEELYRYTARQGGSGYDKASRSLFVGQIFVKPKLVRICLTSHSIVAALVVAAAFVDPRLRSPRSSYAWMARILDQGDAAVNEWLSTVNVATLPPSNGRGGRKSNRTVLQMR
jgi:hypothetical protein